MKFLFYFLKISNYKTTHFHYICADEQKRNKNNPPTQLSVLTVANSLVFILPDISLFICICMLVASFSHLMIDPW